MPETATESPERAERDERVERRVAWATLVVGLVAFVVLAALLIPWHPYPGGHLTPADEHAVFSDDQVARAEHFARWARVWSWGGLAISLAVTVWLGFGRLGRRLVARLRGPWWLRALQATALLTVINAIVGLPTGLALQQLRVHHGLSNESWGAFLIDVVLTAAVTVVTTGLGLLVAMACVRRWSRAWPAVVGGLFAVLVVVGSFVYPLLIEPLFNHFTPLPDGPLRSQILALAAQEGVHIDDVLVSDASRRTTTLNAYVSGFGDSRRVVLYDNTVNSLPDDQIDAIVAHELGHARHDDVLHGTLIGAAAALGAIGLLGVVTGALRRRGRPGPAQPEAVPMLLALVALGTFLALPVENTMSREIETRADVASLSTTHDPAAFVAMQKELALRALADPSPPAWSQWWFGSHPTVLTRVALAQRIDP